MKTSIIYLGIALGTFTNVALAVDFEQSFEEDHRNPQGQTPRNATSEGITGTDTSAAKNYDFTSNASDLPTVPVYQKTMEEIIAEDKQIIESNLTTENNKWEDYSNTLVMELQPVATEKTIEEVILQDSQIIESPVVSPTKQMIVGTSKEILSLQ